MFTRLVPAILFCFLALDFWAQPLDDAQLVTMLRDKVHPAAARMVTDW